MNGIQQDKLQRVLDDGYEFRFGDYLNQGFEIFQKNAGNFIGFALVAGLIIMVANFIPIIGPIANNFFLTPPLTVGAYLVAHKINQGEPTEFRDFFRGFDFVGPLAAATLVVALIVVASLIPMMVAWGTSGFFSWFLEVQSDPFAASDPPDFPFWSMILALPAVYLGVAYSWTNMFIAFYGLGFWEAMEMSRKIISKQWFILFLFSIVVGIIGVIGVVLLVIGIVVTFPIMLCAQYSAFADVTRLMDEAEADLVDHLIE